MDATVERLKRAVLHHRAGELDAAAALYRAVLEVAPEHVDALRLLGLVHLDRNELGLARDRIARAQQLRPSDPELLLLLCDVDHRAGDLAAAIDACRRALALDAARASAWEDLAALLRESGAHAEAADAYTRAVALEPALSHLHYNLGNALRDASRLHDAIEAYKAALRLEPTLGPARENLALALMESGSYLESEGYLRQLIAAGMADASTLNNLGTNLKTQARLHEAVGCLRQAVQESDQLVEAWINLGQCLTITGSFQEATACFAHALQLVPDSAEAHEGMAGARQGAGDIAGALESYDRALAIEPVSAVAMRNRLIAEHYLPGVTPERLAASHARWNQVHAAPLSAERIPHDLHGDQERPLRLGFVSGDLREHPVGYFTVAVLEKLREEGFGLYLYYVGHHQDAWTRRFHATARLWRQAAGWRDADLARRIREDRVDILFDLSGHTAENRLLAFARRPAPVQVTWAGYMGTTGLETMDWIVGDRYHTPPGVEANYVEKILRMPDGYVCYDPPRAAPPVSPPPCLANGFVTFGTFNAPMKIQAPAVALWARAMQRIPGSRLLLKYRGMSDSAVLARLIPLFEAGGIDPARVTFEEGLTGTGMPASYDRVDVALDTMPYSGGLTTCEALWMGVPVVTFPGTTFASRHSLSHLSNAGLSELVARDGDDFVAIATALAHDRARLTTLRAGMRERLLASPLCDATTFARALGDFCREAWRGSKRGHTSF